MNEKMKVACPNCNSKETLITATHCKIIETEYGDYLHIPILFSLKCEGCGHKWLDEKSSNCEAKRVIKKLERKQKKELEQRLREAKKLLDGFPCGQTALDEARERLNQKGHWINLGSIESEIELMRKEWLEHFRAVLKGKTDDETEVVRKG